MNLAISEAEREKIVTEREIIMKYLEIIELCTVGSNRAHMEVTIRELCSRLRDTNHGHTVSSYSHGFLETDYSIHVRYEKDTRDGHPSAAGQEIAEALKQLGIVNHTVWIETEK